MQRISTFKTEHSHHLEPRLAPQRSTPEPICMKADLRSWEKSVLPPVLYGILMGFYGGLMGSNGILMGFSWDFMVV